MTQTLMITRGLPASGKSTFAMRWVAEKPGERARVNRDDVRFATFGKHVLEPELEGVITAIEHASVRALLAAGKSVVLDNQNLRARYVKPYLKLAAEAGAVVLHKDFNEELAELLRRNRQRERLVPEEYITKAYKNFVRKGAFGPFPTLEEAEAADPFAPHHYVPDASLPTAWLVDMDGTYALMNGRRGPYDFDRVLDDDPNEPVVELVRSLKAAGHTIIVLSGRDDIAIADTLTWLQVHEGPVDEIYMRAANDRRKDWIVKLELFERHVAPRYNVRGVLDDRLQVARMWHAIGLPLFRVGDPEANF